MFYSRMSTPPSRFIRKTNVFHCLPIMGFNAFNILKIDLRFISCQPISTALNLYTMGSKKLSINIIKKGFKYYVNQIFVPIVVFNLCLNMFPFEL